MLSVAVLAIVVLLIAGTAFLALRGRFASLAADRRGIALQTVIVIVVLLAIAGAVAGVLLQRGSEAVKELEKSEVNVNLDEIDNETLCLEAGGAWAAGACAG